jgi:hypothetical protein
VSVFRVKFTDGNRIVRIDVKAPDETFAGMKADGWVKGSQWRRISVTRLG